METQLETYQIKERLRNVRVTHLRRMRTLGQGHFGHVDLVKIENDGSGLTFALKKIRKSSGPDCIAGTYTKSEKELLAQVDCNFIAELYKTFATRRYHYLLLESCPGGTLKRMLDKKGRFDSDTARFYVACVIEATGYLHRNCIVFRDLKPENLVLDVRGYPKLIDFGLARKLSEGEKLNQKAGTPDYMAPEILAREYYDMSVDYWSLGVMVFQFLCGKYPFKGYPNLPVLYGNIARGIDEVAFPKCIPEVAVELIRELCRMDPAERLTDQNGTLRGHGWFDNLDWEAVRQKSLPAPIRPRITVPNPRPNQNQRRHGHGHS